MPSSLTADASLTFNGVCCTDDTTTTCTGGLFHKEAARSLDPKAPGAGPHTRISARGLVDSCAKAADARFAASMEHTSFSAFGNMPIQHPSPQMRLASQHHFGDLDGAQTQGTPKLKELRNLRRSGIGS